MAHVKAGGVAKEIKIQFQSVWASRFMAARWQKPEVSLFVKKDQRCGPVSEPLREPILQFCTQRRYGEICTSCRKTIRVCRIVLSTVRRS